MVVLIYILCSFLCISDIHADNVTQDLKTLYKETQVSSDRYLWGSSIFAACTIGTIVNSATLNMLIENASHNLMNTFSAIGTCLSHDGSLITLISTSISLAAIGITKRKQASRLKQILGRTKESQQDQNMPHIRFLIEPGKNQVHISIHYPE